MSKVPTQKEIDKEIATLKEMKPKVPHRTMFGDDNWKAIDAQIDVLANKLSETYVYEQYEDGEKTHVLDSALEARRWLDGTEDAPSEGWEGLVK